MKYEVDNLSILRNISASDVQLHPYPHVMIRDALPDDIYKDMEDSFPDLRSLYEGDPDFGSKAFVDFGSDVVKRAGTSNSWRSFLDYHMKKSFFDDFIRVFSDHIDSVFPDLERSLNTKISDFVVVTRDDETARIRQTQSQDQIENADHDVAMSNAIALGFTHNNPRVHAGPHLDRTYKLFSSLLYMRDPKDSSEGGDLILHKLKDPSRLRKNRVIYTSVGRHFKDNIVEEVVRIPYEKNIAVIFLNSPNSIHGVTSRTPTKIPRRAVYINAEVSKITGFYSCIDDEARRPVNRLKKVIKRIISL